MTMADDAAQASENAEASPIDVLDRLRQALQTERDAEQALAQARRRVGQLLTQAREAGLRYHTIARSLVPAGDPHESLRERRAMVGRLRQRCWTARRRQRA